MRGSFWKQERVKNCALRAVRLRGDLSVPVVLPVFGSPPSLDRTGLTGAKDVKPEETLHMSELRTNPLSTRETPTNLAKRRKRTVFVMHGKRKLTGESVGDVCIARGN